MQEAKEKIAAVLVKAPLPAQLRKYFQDRLEREGVTPVLVESIKSMLRSVEENAYARMGFSIDEDESPDLKRAAKLYSDAVANAADKYLNAANEAAGKIVTINKKAVKVIEKMQKEVARASIE